MCLYALVRAPVVSIWWKRLHLHVHYVQFVSTFDTKITSDMLCDSIAIHAVESTLDTTQHAYLRPMQRDGKMLVYNAPIAFCTFLCTIVQWTYHIVIEPALISHFPSNMDGTASALLLCHLQLPLFSHVAHVWNWFCTRSTHLLADELQFMLVWW